MGNFFSSSYSNLIRLLGFNIKVDFFKDEYEKYTYYGRIQKNEKFKCYNKEEISSSMIIADYLSLINKFFFKKDKNEENVNYDFTTLSVPDYYTDYHKQELKLICESLGMKDINIINESTAITMYYGYTKYRDMFVENKEVKKTNENNIIFIDIGHSKTTFIYSNFKYNEFKVKKVKNLPFIGGRNFDLSIMNEC